LQHGATLLHGTIRSQDHGKRAQHKHHRAPGGGFGQDVGSAARTERRLATGAAEGAREISGFAALQEHYDDQHHAVDYEKTGQEPPGIAKSEGNNSYADQ
jgi:hypothetical protein